MVDSEVRALLLSPLFRRALEMCSDSFNCRTKESESDEASASHYGVLPEC